ncbi:MAG TPA: DUF4760 domain-containing protein [Thermoanaerobaculia bacterium]|nr:DUF4760 domain-containing protein [Thermoanaerobaculia bacterium]
MKADIALQLANITLWLAAILVGWWQLRLFRKQVQQEYDKARRDNATTYFLNRIPEHLQARERLHELLETRLEDAHTSAPLDRLQKSFDEDEKLKLSVIGLLSHWEGLALTVAVGMTDEDVAFEMQGYSFVTIVSKLQGFIDSIRSTSNPRSYVYLELLSKRWKERLAQQGSTPFFVFPDTMNVRRGGKVVRSAEPGPSTGMMRSRWKGVSAR